MYKLGTNEVLGYQCSIRNGFGVQGKPVKVSKSPISIEILDCRIYIHFLHFILCCLQMGGFFFVALLRTSNNLQIHGFVLLFLFFLFALK